MAENNGESNNNANPTNDDDDDDADYGYPLHRAIFLDESPQRLETLLDSGKWFPIRLLNALIFFLQQASPT